MAIFNFKVKEESGLGGGVYYVGSGNSVQIQQSNYPNVNLSTMTANNFFKRTKLIQSDEISVSNNDNANILLSYTGGNTSLQYSYANGVGTVTVTETPRTEHYEITDFATYTNSDTKSSGYTHDIFMSKDAII